MNKEAEGVLPEQHHLVEASDGALMAKAAARAAERLGISKKDLAAIIPSGDRDSFEQATLFVRLQRVLDAWVGGNAKAAASWLTSRNTALGGRPIDRMQSKEGLREVLSYLESRGL